MAKTVTILILVVLFLGWFWREMSKRPKHEEACISGIPVPKERLILALGTAIERSNEDLSRPYVNNFERYVAQLEPQIRNNHAIQDFDLACLYNFSRYYFFCVSHGDPEVDGLTAAEAGEELAEALSKLKRGETAMSAVIRRYTRPD